MRVTADEIYEAIAARFSPPEWACFAELPSTTGYGAGRRADAVAFNLWPSRGLEVRGFEIKVSRSDLVHEIRDIPEKAEGLAEFCDTWWLVCPKEILATVDADVIPLGWGVLAYHPKTKTKLLRLHKPAEQNANPTPIDRAFLAAVLRKAHARVEHVEGQYIHRDAIDDRLQAEYQRGIEGAACEKDHVIAGLQDKAAAVDVFAEALGVDFDERGWEKKVTTAKEAIETMAVGQAVMGKYGNNLQIIASIGEQLVEIGKRIKTIGNKLDAQTETTTPEAV